MKRFCGKCGAKVDELTGLCPNCEADKIRQQTGKSAEPTQKSEGKAVQDKNKSINKKEARKQHKAEKEAAKKERKARKKAAKKAKKKEKWKAKTFGQKLKSIFLRFIGWVFLLAFLIGCILGMLVYFDKIDIPIINSVFEKAGISKQENNSDILAHNLEELKEIDIGQELRGESQILETIDVATSDLTTSEADIAKQFRDKGFIDSVIYTAYSMDGTYNGDEMIDENSSESHPLYYATYICDNNYCWTVYFCNGEWLASPISYMYSGLTTLEIMVSEKDYIMSYDSYTNCFYKMIPSTNECIIKTVSVINSETLDELAKKEFSTL